MATLHLDSPELTPVPSDDESAPRARLRAGRERNGACVSHGHGDGPTGETDLDSELGMEIDERGAMDEYELERAENIRNNAALLASLGLNSAPAIRPHSATTARTGAGVGAGAGGNSERKSGLSTEELRVRREARARAAALKRDVAPTRRSGRVAAQVHKVDYDDDLQSLPSPPVKQVKYEPIPKQVAPTIPSGPEYELDGATPGERFLPDQPRPSRREDGTLVFEGRWRDVFTPNITPEEMFRGGAFGGAFFCDTYSHTLKSPLSAKEDIASLPFALPVPLHATHLARDTPEGSANRFGVRAGQSLQEWEKAGWVWSADPRGWAQWYVRFWSGRRSVDDERQVRRWLKVAGPTGRFKRALLKKVHQSGGRGVLGDEDVGRVVRQTLWQWGYELTEAEYDRAMQGE